MTVATSVRSKSFAGGQENLTFSFKTVPSHPEHIKVTLKLISTGVETELTYDTHYTVHSQYGRSWRNSSRLSYI